MKRNSTILSSSPLHTYIKSPGYASEQCSEYTERTHHPGRVCPNGYTYDDAGEKGQQYLRPQTRHIRWHAARLPINGRATSCTASPIPERYWKLIRNTGFLPQLTARIGQFKTMYTIENRCLLFCRTDKLLFTGGQLSGRYQRQRSTLRLQQRPWHGYPYHGAFSRKSWVITLPSWTGKASIWRKNNQKT